MVTKKTSTKKKEMSSVTQEELNDLVNDSYTKGEEVGKQEGTTEVWKAMSAFLKERMIMHFENHRDDLAREYREILLAVSKNIT